MLARNYWVSNQFVQFIIEPKVKEQAINNFRVNLEYY
jgi:hypothetical protein